MEIGTKIGTLTSRTSETIPGSPSQDISLIPATDSFTFADMRQYLAAKGLETRYTALRSSAPISAWYQVIASWGWIAASWAALVWVLPWYFFPIALVIIGSRQRAINNILHDASHNNLFRKRQWNRVFANVFSAWPMVEDYTVYSTRHLQHHAHLGDPKRDPDYPRTPVVVGGSTAVRAAGFYGHFAFSPKEWFSSIFGAWRILGGSGRIGVSAWWIMALALLVATCGIKAALAFLGLWMGSRATMYHLIRVFAEISDHNGLPPGPIAQYTRNMPDNLWSIIFHPFHDNYHMTHHFFPNVPVIRLDKLHQLLMDMPVYAEAQRIDGYFLGAFPITRSWVETSKIG